MTHGVVFWGEPGVCRHFTRMEFGRTLCGRENCRNLKHCPVPTREEMFLCLLIKINFLESQTLCLSYSHSEASGVWHLGLTGNALKLIIIGPYGVVLWYKE